MRYSFFLKFIVQSSAVFYGVISFGQVTNPVLAELDRIKTNKIDSLVNFNADKIKLQFLALLPSINYNVADNSFNVGVSISNLGNYYQNKQRNKIELERLRFQLSEYKERSLLLLDKEYELLLDNFDLIKMELDNNSITEEIFKLKKAQYDNNKINLEEWLNVQQNFQEKKKIQIYKRKNLISKMEIFEKKIESNCFVNQLLFLKANLFK
jgi:hypothetical protein